MHPAIKPTNELKLAINVCPQRRVIPKINMVLLTNHID